MHQIVMTFLAALVTSLIDLSIAIVAQPLTNVPKDFPPFTILPILSGTIGGAILASISFALIKLFDKTPERTFLFVTIAILALSFLLPIRLSFTQSTRFAGVTASSQMILVLMHSVVASITVAALLSKPQP